MNRTPRMLQLFPVVLLAALFTRTAFAHAGHDHATLESGLMHPLTGIDHILAMVAVGLWAFQLGGRAVWALPLTFVGIMALGAGLGVGGPERSWTEHGILASVAILGLAIASAYKVPAYVSMLLVAAFAFCHGYAHGHEAGAGGSFAAYTTGFMLASASLHALGLGLGYAIHKFSSMGLVRYAGGAIAAGAVMLWMNAN